MRLFSPRRVYADYASSVPLSPRARRAMERALDLLGNPSSIHEEGILARAALEAARVTAARFMEVKPDEVVFTASATESDNLAIAGAVPEPHGAHIITTRIEHSAVLEPIRKLEARGASVTYLPVDDSGRISLDELAEAIRPETVLVSISAVNGEIGSVERVRDIGRLVRERGSAQPIYFHTDASQAPFYISIRPHDWSADLLTLDSRKVGGPAGAGLLVVARGTPLSPLMRGGGQERGLRPGTENVAAIAGFAEALKEAGELRQAEGRRLARLRDELERKLLAAIPGASVNCRKSRLPNMLNICIPGADAEFLSVKLDAAGIALSAASACRSISGEGSSYVIEALPEGAACARSSLRISLGRGSGAADVSRLVREIPRLAAS